MEKDNRIDNPTTENNEIHEIHETPVNPKQEEQVLQGESELQAEPAYMDPETVYETAAEPASEELPETAKPQSRKVVKKKKKKKRKKNPNWLARLFVLAIFIAIVIAVLHIDYFTVDEINVTGNDYLTEKQVLKGSKIKTGENIFDIHIMIEKSKLSKNPYIDDIKIHRKLPNIINVEVTEPVGMAQFQVGTSKKYAVTDNEGTVLEVATTQRQIVLISGIVVNEAEVGSKIGLRKGQDKVFDQMMELVRVTDENDMFFKKIEVADGRVTAYVFDGLKAKGTIRNVTDSLESGTLRTVVYDLYQKDVKKGTINVSADNYCSFTKK
ncbi:MAG: FtsQ-type POTRA domain-containing protein [Eubacterium sp.]|nr:FtsQ-type POTRA domain-containing protein [Candidatus Colimonas fimequi]